MFEDLNNKNSVSDPNNTNNNSVPNQGFQNQPEVDDIFAETDGGDNNNVNQMSPKRSDIVTKQVGLGANSNLNYEQQEEEADKKGGKMFTIIVIIMVVIILGLLGFLVYSKFFQPADEVTIDNNIPGVVDNKAPINNEEPDLNQVEELGSETTTTPEVDDFNDFIPLVPGEEETEINLEEETDLIIDEPVVSAPVDSDSDGLTDEEELTYSTNPLLVDSDSDGLSDYEEVKIYNTNPLNVDSDSDSYPDGEEVQNGYNPLGEGMLAG